MRKQRAFAGLTEKEIEQIADWLRSVGPDSTYDAIRERIAKPRPEGFGLTISNKPLQLLWEKTNRVERINNRIASGQRLTLSEFDAIQAGEKSDLAEEIHDAIMDETHAMATSGENTPTQLLALRRLADFPARAEYREHKRQLELRKEELNLRKGERDAEKHAHKVQMDLQKSAHKIQMDLEKAAQKKEMDEHRKRLAEERLALAKRSLDLREKSLEMRGAAKSSNSALCTPNSALEDDLGPLATTLDEIEARATKKFCLPPLTPTQNLLAQAHDSSATAGSHESLPLSESLSKTSSPNSSEPSPHPAGNLINTDFQGQPIIGVTTTVSTVSQPRPLSQMEPQPPIDEPPIHPPTNPPTHRSSLEDRVSAYTLARHHEAAHGKNPLIVGKYAAWNFKSKMQWCPCGNQHLPCPDHGDFPSYFWQLSPDSTDYLAVLRSKNLPFTSPYQLLREQERNAKRLAAQKSAPLQIENSQLSTLHSQLKSHALRRWIAYTPFRPAMPPRDQSWHEECPCGAKLPCDHHDDLWIEVHYMKPWDPNYSAALARHNIPFHRPTDEELQAAPAAPSSETLWETSSPVSEPKSSSDSPSVV